MNALDDYLAEIARRRFVYGELDCCIFMADWLVRLGFADPMADRRGSYRSEEEYRRALRAERGLLRSCQSRFAAIGLRQVRHTAAAPGGVCLVRAPNWAKSGRLRWGATGAIVISERLRAIVAKDEGLVLSDLKVLHAWEAQHA